MTGDQALSWAKIGLVIAGVAVVGYVIYKAKGAVSAAVSAVNPVNPNNIFSEGTNAVLFPSGSDSLGTWIYGIFHPGQ